MHDREWRGSVMHYAAASPVFNAFELTVQKLTEGRFAPDGSSPNFCSGCHSPTGVYNAELSNFADGATPLVDDLSETALDGLSCDFCHTVTGPDLEGSVLGDGIANLALEYAPSWVKQGPFSDARRSSYHTSTNNDYLRDPAFCGACHDVRLPIPDVVTGEPFQRLENLFTEWETGPYNSDANPYGRVVTCQDCHMSLYPTAPPGSYPLAVVSETSFEEPRRHALHAFTAVSIPLVDDPRFPSTDRTDVDEWGFPVGQQARREQMLAAAVSLTLRPMPASVEPNSNHLPIELTLVNKGAGHRVPAGFSQEREVWVELVVRDDAGVLYESGTLVDSAHPETGELVPDGLLDDEPLRDHSFDIDLDTFTTRYVEGPDRNQRPRRNLGLVNFQNHFVRVNDDGSEDRVLNPLEANHMDNSHSLPILEPVTVRYDVPIERAIVGEVHVSARLRYRSFPPDFLRFLAMREPTLVSEDTVDRNTIVDMASVVGTVPVYVASGAD